MELKLAGMAGDHFTSESQVALQFLPRKLRHLLLKKNSQTRCRRDLKAFSSIGASGQMLCCNIKKTVLAQGSYTWKPLIWPLNLHLFETLYFRSLNDPMIKEWQEEIVKYDLSFIRNVNQCN